MQKSISVVLPNYNGKELLQQNLPSVYLALQTQRCEFEIIIADDASSDDSIAFLKQNYPAIIILRSDNNQGFSPTINRGIRQAKNELVLLLNTDVQLFPDYFLKLLNYFSEPDTFGVSGRFIGLNDDIIQEAGKYPELSSTKKIQPFNFFVESPTSWVPTLFLCGGCSLIDRTKLEILKGFDEIYAPFYVEDADLSIRAWRMGWKCYYEHHSVCRHPAATTIKKFHKKKSIWITSQRNKLILHELHLSVSSKVIWNSRQLITLLVQGLAFRWKYHKAFLLFLQRLKLLKEQPTIIYKKTLEDVIGEIIESLKTQQITRLS